MNNIFMSENEIRTKVETIAAQHQNHTLHMYIDITGDLVCGTLLSQIMYWFSKDKNGDTKLRVFKDGYLWLAKQRGDWYDEIRITKRQYDYAIKELKKRNLVILGKYKFNSLPTIHIRPNYDVINAEINKWKETVKNGIINDDVNSALREEYEGKLIRTPQSKDKESQKDIQVGNDEKRKSRGNDEKCKTGITKPGIPLTMITNRDYQTETTDQKASSNDEVQSYKASNGCYVTPSLPYDYSQAQFEGFIQKKVQEIVEREFPDEKDSVPAASEIIAYFYNAYRKNMGERHPKMSDAVYTGIIKKLLYPIDTLVQNDCRLDVEAYMAMIDRFFVTEYGIRLGHTTDKHIGYFFSDAVLENLYYRELY